MGRVVVSAIALLICSPAFTQEPPEEAADLWNEAVLYRDEWGVPHIFSDNPRAMAFAFGYAQAEDHLESMLLSYRFAQGRSSEVLGEDVSEVDRLSIRLDHIGLAHEAYGLADAVTRDLCEGFALGVNTWITEHPDETPDWADGVHPADVLALLHRYLLSQEPFDYPDAFHLLPGTPSANAWAVGPEMSKTREAMLVMNPHSNYEGPFQWYEAHLVTRELNVYGATLFGLPVILQGHNAVLGWALAPNSPDTADVYVEYGDPGRRGDPKSTIRAMRENVPGGVSFVDEEQREYFVKTEGGFVPYYETRAATVRGPVVAQAEGHPLTWRTGGYGAFGALRQLHDMGLAQDLDAFRRALDRQQLSTFHVVYADVAGNIFYQYNANTGRRQDSVAGRHAGLAPEEAGAEFVFAAPLPTTDSRYEWGASIPPDALPWLLNPVSGYVQACGTPPWLATTQASMDPGTWPAWLIRDEDSYRAKRVRRLLSLGPRSFEDMQAMLFDTVSPLAAEAVPYLLSLAEENPGFIDDAHPDLRVMLDVLRDWNYLTESGSMAMTAFHIWWTLLRLDENGEPTPNEMVHRLIQEDAVWFQEHALNAASDAAQLLRNEYQTLNIPWGDVHVIVRGDREEPLAGGHSGEPLFSTGDTLFDDGKWRVSEGYGFAMVVRFGAVPEAVSMVPFGSSELAVSAHFDDQLDLMLGRRLKVARFTREDVERHAELAIGRRVLLRPRHQVATVFVAADYAISARLVEAATPPTALPEGLAAYTTYFEPIVDQEAPAVLAMDLDVHIDESLCDVEALESVYLYGYHPVDGWRALEEQELDSGRRALTAVVGRGEVFAALGPAATLRGEPALVRPAGETRRTSARKFFAANLRADSTPETVAAARNDDSSVTTLAEEDEQRVAAMVPRTPRVLEPHDEEYEQAVQQLPPNITKGKFPRVVPSVPPGFEPERLRPTAPQIIPESRPSAQSDTGSVSGKPEFGGAFVDAGSEPESAEHLQFESPQFAAEDLTPLESGDAAPRATDGFSGAHETPTTRAPTRIAAAPSSPVAGKKRGVSWSDKTPVEMSGGSAFEAQPSFDLAPDPSKASEMQFGTQLELRTPDGAAVFTVRAQKTVRAQAYQRERAPAAYPPGLAAFSAVYDVQAEPASAAANTAFTIQLAPSVIDPARFGELRLYTFDAAQGWQPLAGQRSSSESLIFSGMDFSIRTYAILGPADAAAR